MWKLKLLGGALLISGAVALFAYVQYLRAENATHLANAAVSDATIDALNEELEVRQRDAEQKTEMIRIRNEQIADLRQRGAQLSRELNDVVHEDPIVVQCLAVKPGREYISRLRKYAKGSTGDEAGETVSAPVAVREPDTRRPHG